jgi:type IV pilus assembly protein PilC
MAKYKYVITDNSGRRLEGVMSASDQDSATKKLREKEPDKIIISVTESKNGKIWIFGRPSMGIQEKMMFVKHLSTMVKVGIPIIEALEILAEQSSKKANKTMFKDIIEMIQSGQTLSNSMRKYDYIFSDLFVNMIETGEKSGNLENVLDYLDMQLEKDYEVRRKIVSSFIYPAIIVSVSIIMAIGIAVFIMPKITKIFERFDLQLPLPTRIIIGVSKLLTEQTLLVLLLIAIVLTIITVITRIKALKPFWHRIILMTPIFGEILITANIARFSRSMSSLLQSGTPVMDALKVTAKMLDNSIYKNAIESTAEKVEQGGQLGESFEGYEKIFPQIVTKMLYIGEKSGSLESTSGKLAELFEKKVDAKTRNLSVVLEPILLVLMAVLVGGMAMSIILPIYKLPSLLAQ